MSYEAAKHGIWVLQLGDKEKMRPFCLQTVEDIEHSNDA